MPADPSLSADHAPVDSHLPYCDAWGQRQRCPGCRSLFREATKEANRG